MQDSWCQPTISKNGVRVSGGAARNVRIAARGGMDEIIKAAAHEAARLALEQAELAIRNQRKPHLRLVKKAA